MSIPPTAETPPVVGSPLETAILFVDLVNSSDFASVLTLRDFAAYVDSFEQTCRRQCEYYFESFHGGKYKKGAHYSWEFTGDELVVFLHTDRPTNDVYQLVCLAISLKCGWLGSSVNVERAAAGISVAELAAGIHIGNVWSTPNGNGYCLRGAAIATAKRVETASRSGDRFRIFVSDSAFHRIGRQARNLLFSPRHVEAMKGIVVAVAVRELHDSFMDFSRRLEPGLAKAFRDVAISALHSATFDLWINSCLQIWDEKANGRVTDECMDLCRHVLKLEPSNAVALFHAAQAARERGDVETAHLYLLDLTACTPLFADGWLELGRVMKLKGDLPAARRAIIQARRHGVSEAEEALP